MNKILWEKIREAFSSVLPITAIVLIASVVLVPMPSGTVLLFLAGAALLIIGMGFFTLGADMAMMPMGEGIGIFLTKTKSLALSLTIALVMGVVITIAEPDLQVLAQQVSSIPRMTLIVTVGIGVGIFLAIAVLRILLRIRLATMLIVFYGIVFIVLIFTPEAFVPIAFDSGGVTTGPMTVPFILAMGLGFATLRSDKDSQDDSFGLVALCSVGPILAVMCLGIFFNPTEMHPATHTATAAGTSRDVVLLFAEALPASAKNVLSALGSVVVFFILFQLITRRYKIRQIERIAMGFLYTFIGLVVFLTGVEVGFIPVGHLLGTELGGSPLRWILIPLGMVIGYFIVAAEPAVHVLNKQVEEVSGGMISAKVMQRGLSVGMAIALAVSMTRILTGIPILWILVPGYAVALILTFFVPPIFTGIAFDSGGVCTGPMTSTFLLPLTMGACQGAGGNIMTDAFGIVAVVAMTPLIIIQGLGLVYSRQMKAAAALEGAGAAFREEGAIWDYQEEFV